MDDAFAYAFVTINAIGISLVLVALMMRDLRLKLSKKCDLIMAKQDAIMKKLIEIKPR